MNSNGSPSGDLRRAWRTSPKHRNVLPLPAGPMMNWTGIVPALYLHALTRLGLNHSDFRMPRPNLFLEPGARFRLAVAEHDPARVYLPDEIDHFVPISVR